MPYISETLAIIGLCLQKDNAVGYMYDPACTLIALHPVSHLQNGKLEKAYIDHIPGILSYLDPVTHRKWFTGVDEKPAGYICQWIF